MLDEALLDDLHILAEGDDEGGMPDLTIGDDDGDGVVAPAAVPDVDEDDDLEDPGKVDEEEEEEEEM